MLVYSLIVACIFVVDSDSDDTSSEDSEKKRCMKRRKATNAVSKIEAEYSNSQFSTD